MAEEERLRIELDGGNVVTCRILPDTIAAELKAASIPIPVVTLTHERPDGPAVPRLRPPDGGNPVEFVSSAARGVVVYLTPYLVGEVACATVQGAIARWCQETGTPEGVVTILGPDGEPL